MPRWISAIIWTAVALAGAGAMGYMALSRGEAINAAWLLTAAVCTYLVGYRFYSRIIAAKVFALDDRRLTPAVRLEDGQDYVPTNRWIVFGHHFAAIAGPGPLVGRLLAAVEEAAGSGEVESRSEALDYARSLYEAWEREPASRPAGGS